MRSFLLRVRRRLAWLRRPHRPVRTGAFDTSTRTWRDREVTDGVERDELTVATFNIWFKDYFADERYQAIADEMAGTQPDVMVFQEVTPRAKSILLDQPWVQEGYYRAEITGDILGNYGMLMLSRLPIQETRYSRLPTKLDRGFLRARLVINGRALSICSVHLESGKSATLLRARQIHRVFDALGDSEDAVVLGDFNMRDHENTRISAPYRDIWPELRPDDPGYTEDTSINHMRFDSKPKHRQVRFDRVLYRGARWAPASIELLGTAPISPELPRVFPSDHFGVLCRFESTV